MATYRCRNRDRTIHNQDLLAVIQLLSTLYIIPDIRILLGKSLGSVSEDKQRPEHNEEDVQQGVEKQVGRRAFLYRGASDRWK